MEEEMDLALPKRRCASSASALDWVACLLEPLSKLADLHQYSFITSCHVPYQVFVEPHVVNTSALDEAVLSE